MLVPARRPGLVRLRSRAVWPVLVFGGPGQGPRGGRWPGPAVRCIGGLGVGSQHVRQRGPHAQDQDQQAGHGGRDRPRRPCHPSLGHQVVGDLPRHPEGERADRRPLGEPACPGADRRLAGQPGPRRVSRVGLDADRERDGGVQVERGPDSRQRADQAEAGHLRDPDPAGPHFGRGRGGQDRTARSARTAAPDRSAAAGPADRTEAGSAIPASLAAARSVTTGRAAMGITTPPA